MVTHSRRVNRVPIVLAGGLAASLASLFVFGKIADEVMEHEAMAFDERLVGAARARRSPTLDRLMSSVTATGEPWALGGVGAMLGMLWWREQRRADVAALGLAFVGGGLVNQLLKTMFRRERPALKLRRAHASGYSFPSGHAMTTLSSYGAVAYLAGRRGSLKGQPAMRLLWLPVLLLCAWVGASRVYLEVHYPTDVLGGWAAATVWVTTCGIARAFMEPEES